MALGEHLLHPHCLLLCPFGLGAGIVGLSLSSPGLGIHTSLPTRQASVTWRSPGRCMVFSWNIEAAAPGPPLPPLLFLPPHWEGNQKFGREPRGYTVYHHPKTLVGKGGWTLRLMWVKARSGGQQGVLGVWGDKESSSGSWEPCWGSCWWSCRGEHSKALLSHTRSRLVRDTDVHFPSRFIEHLAPIKDFARCKREVCEQDTKLLALGELTFSCRG